jgi:hypothetical protein
MSKTTKYEEDTGDGKMSDMLFMHMLFAFQEEGIPINKVPEQLTKLYLNRFKKPFLRLMIENALKFEVSDGEILQSLSDFYNKQDNLFETSQQYMEDIPMLVELIELVKSEKSEKKSDDDITIEMDKLSELMSMMNAHDVEPSGLDEPHEPYEPKIIKTTKNRKPKTKKTGETTT